MSLMLRGSVAVLIWGIYAARFAHRLRLNPSTVHEVLTRYEALRVPDQPGDRVRAGGQTESPYRHAAPGQNERPRLLLRCHEAQRGATSSIRKTAGLTLGTTYVT